MSHLLSALFSGFGRGNRVKEVDVNAGHWLPSPTRPHKNEWQKERNFIMLKPNAVLSLHSQLGDASAIRLKRHPQVCSGPILPAVQYLLWETWGLGSPVLRILQIQAVAHANCFHLRVIYLFSNVWRVMSTCKPNASS